MARVDEADVGVNEVKRIKRRMKEINISLEELSIKIGITTNGLKKILSDKKKGVKKLNLDKIMEELGVGVNYIFDEVPNVYNENRYFGLEMKRWRDAVFKSTNDERAYNELTKFGKIVDNVHKFGYTTIIDEISRGYSFVESFFKEKTSFLTMPLDGYWKKFHTSPERIKNCYIKFKIIPKKEKSHFKISYTLGDISLKSNSKFNFKLPKSIRIEYAEIICSKEEITVIQYYNNPSRYIIKNVKEINVFTWLDRAEHYFIVSCESDFDLIYNEQEKFNRNDVSEEFDDLQCVVFQRHPYFHREKIGDIADDVKFFWNNKAFLDFNHEIREKIK